MECSLTFSTCGCYRLLLSAEERMWGLARNATWSRSLSNSTLTLLREKKNPNVCTTVKDSEE
jgi:hypothetical protein